MGDEEIASLSDAQLKTPVIRMFTELVEHGLKIEEKSKAMKNEIKENVQGTNSEEKETGTHQWFGPEKRKKYSTRTE